MRRLKKIATYGTGGVAAISCGMFMDYPHLIWANVFIFLWMFGWGFFWRGVDTRAKLEVKHAKKH